LAYLNDNYSSPTFRHFKDFPHPTVVLPEERGFKCEKQEKQLVAIESLSSKDRILTLLPVDALYREEQQYGNPVV
jgi:hypothetical protein